MMAEKRSLDIVDVPFTRPLLCLDRYGLALYYPAGSVEFSQMGWGRSLYTHTCSRFHKEVLVYSSWWIAPRRRSHEL